MEDKKDTESQEEQAARLLREEQVVQLNTMQEQGDQMRALLTKLMACSSLVSENVKNLVGLFGNLAETQKPNPQTTSIPLSELYDFKLSIKLKSS